MLDVQRFACAMHLANPLPGLRDVAWSEICSRGEYRKSYVSYIALAKSCLAELKYPDLEIDKSIVAQMSISRGIELEPRDVAEIRRQISQRILNSNYSVRILHEGKVPRMISQQDDSA